MLHTNWTSELDIRHRNTGSDTITKFLLTSGSTGQPKVVITTNRMVCSNAMMQRQSMPFLADEPPVVVDWLPWSHTFSGSHIVGLVVSNGGTLYIDDGKPTPAGIAETIRNLREISPTVYFNVPKGFEMIAHHLREDEELRSPSVTPGYWRQPALTAAAFDDEGFYRLGDAVRLLDQNDPTRGLVFDGRIGEDFKLSNGTG